VAIGNLGKDVPNQTLTQGALELEVNLLLCSSWYTDMVTQWHFFGSCLGYFL